MFIRKCTHIEVKVNTKVHWEIHIIKIVFVIQSIIICYTIHENCIRIKLCICNFWIISYQCSNIFNVLILWFYRNTNEILLYIKYKIHVYELLNCMQMHQNTIIHFKRRHIYRRNFWIEMGHKAPLLSSLLTANICSYYFCLSCDPT